MFGRLLKRSGKSERRTGSVPDGKDEAIIHLTVPDEVLYPDRTEAPDKDMSWLDALPASDSGTPPEAARPAPARVVAEVAKAPDPEGPEPRQAVEPETMNPRAEGRPRFPYGWLVVVEGPGTGEWFPLERGTSVVGGAGAQTVALDFGDEAIGEGKSVTLTFDEMRHAFTLDSSGPFRVNGDTKRSRLPLRDGDVFTIGGTSLRLVALCSRNFHWAEDIAAE